MMKKILRTLLVTGPLFTGLSTIAIFVVAVQVLAGCGAAQYTIAREVDEARLARAATLAQNKVAIFAPPPSTAELTTFLGEPSTYGAEDLTFDVYELRYDQVKALNELLSNRGIAGDWLPVNESTFSGSDAAEIAVLIPLDIFFLPITITEMVIHPQRAGIEKIPKPRRLVFAYDMQNRYRWTFCCAPNLAPVSGTNPVTTPEFRHERLYEIATLLSGTRSNSAQMVREDKMALFCQLAKMGDARGAYHVYREIDLLGLDPVQAYYWARVFRDSVSGSNLHVSQQMSGVPDEVVKVGEALYKTTPISGVDCREMAKRVTASAGDQTRYMAMEWTITEHEVEAARAEVDRAVARLQLKRRAEEGDPDAQWEFANIVPIDQRQKLRCLAAHGGNAKAQNSMRVMYRYGLPPLKEDKVQALKWEMLSKASGYTSGGYPESTMSPKQIAEAERLVAEWKPNPVECEREAELAAD